MRTAASLCLTLILTLLYTAPAEALDGVVNRVQSPAWVVRDGRRIPARPGLEVRGGDRLVTGRQSRIELALVDGARFQVGADGEVETDADIQRSAPEAPQTSSDTLTDTVDILKGAFRFTTDIFGQADRPRDLTIRNGIATIGIRGTDVWGRLRGEGSDQEGIVVLIEGEVSVELPDGQRSLGQPLSVIQTRGQQYQTGTADRSALGQLAAETNMHPDRAVMSRDGGTALVLMSVRERRHADDLVRRLTLAGYPAEVLTASVDGSRYHRVAVRQLAGTEQARLLQDELVGRFGIRGAWIL